MPYDLSTLSPAETNRLLAALIEKVGLDAPMEGHTDAAQDIETMQPVIDAVLALCEKVKAIDEKLEGLDKIVMDEIIGGVTNLYNERKRMCGVDELSGKYKEKFDPYADFYKELSGSDLYDKLYDEIQEMKGGEPEWNEEKESGAIEQILGALKAKHDKIKGITPPVDGVAIEVSTATAEPDEQGKLAERIREMRKKFPEVKM
jgi:hypothetical protein